MAIRFGWEDAEGNAPSCIPSNGSVHFFRPNYSRERRICCIHCGEALRWVERTEDMDGHWE